jgi:DNA (cytosine-5)-methyltransferase 1
VDNPFQSPAILSLCTGMRGLERGIERVIGPTRPVAYVEIEAFIIENMVQQMEAGVLAPAPVWANLKTFPSFLFRNRVSGIIGGYPCQPFSQVGERAGESDERHLWPYIGEIIRTIEPVWCQFENVANHLNIGYETVRRELQELGYRVEEGIFSAEEVGAPHRRERLYILAVDHSKCERLERYEGIEGDSSGWKSPVRSIAEASLFPAKCGQDQMEWEYERTIESSMGLTINGYNFREDLLRMAGNAVVEQTAELAFRTLLGKHGLI